MAGTRFRVDHGRWLARVDSSGRTRTASKQLEYRARQQQRIDPTRFKQPRRPTLASKDMHLALRAMRKSRKKQQTGDLVFPVRLPRTELM